MSGFIRVAAVCVVLAALAAPLAAQTKAPVSEGASVSKSFTITAIDFKNRLVTLQDKDGLSETIYAGPDVKRFDELKVGNVVTFTYRESVVVQIEKPSAAAKPASDQTRVTRNEGAMPGGTIARQMTATVTVEAIDLKTPAVTIRQDDGSRSSFKVENRKYLDGLKAGDRVLITYTMALGVSVTPGK
jgi:Cu/Ag efflux protein CusF